MRSQIRATETQMANLFSVNRPFSAHLTKWEDSALPDKYDHNCFAYTAEPTPDEIRRAAAYQRQRGDTFLKLEGDAPLTDDFGLDVGVTLTMALTGDAEHWKTNPNLDFHRPALAELEAIEEKHFGAVYGVDFSRRNVRRLYEQLAYHGAYLDGILVGACYSYSFGGCTCIDGLIVDAQFRRRYVATSLLAHIVRHAAGQIVFLHADADDTPKEMYEKLGFREVDRLHEYLCADLDALAL